RIPYFQELGVNFIHLMPILKSRNGERDGGYAVVDYRAIDERFGTMDDFRSLVDALQKNGIDLCIDYVINHVAKEHAWAQAALEGDPDMQKMFIMYEDDRIPNAYNETVPEVLPDKYPGNFTYYKEIGRHVFTSFSEYQWDLNFANPRVFNGMVDNLLFLANLGISMIRLDAIPFMWKEIGTTCRNLAPIHDLLHMINTIANDVAPSLALLGEAIVEPAEIVKYFGSEQKPECEVMYNANLMVNVYNAFAARDVRLLTVDTNLHQVPSQATWMNYLRCHDDIGWGFNEDAIRSFGLDPHQHKQFLIRFYNDDFPGTFSSGEYYQYNPVNQDARTNGTLASLLGLEKALRNNERFKERIAIDRINLANALILSYRGFPLIYSGDEIATINDHSYLEYDDKKNDGRWVHRPFFDWKRARKRDTPETFEHAVFQQLKRLIALRKELPFLSGNATQFALDLGNLHVLCLIRRYRNRTFFALFNFSEQAQTIRMDYLRQQWTSERYLDVTQGRRFGLYDQEIELSPYEYLWCKPEN
ncbi:MAG: alpha-amylase family glycosyl hydrolase, partial [Acholeplasmataceae bacterium]